MDVALKEIGLTVRRILAFLEFLLRDGTYTFKVRNLYTLPYINSSTTGLMA